MKATDINIMRGELEHLPMIAVLEEEIFGPVERFTKTRLNYLLGSTNSCFFVAVKRNVPIGYGIALKNQMRNGKTKGRIYSLGVIKSYRSAGVGTRLLERMESWLINEGSVFITLETKANKGGAKGFFQRHGYEVTEYLPKYYNPIDGLRMRKTRSTLIASRSNKQQTSARP